MEIGFKKIVCNLLGITARSYSNWAKELRPIITFFEKGYLNKNELKEFLDTGKIKKLDLIKNYSFEELKNKLNTQQVIYDDDYIIRNLTFKFLIFNNKKALISLRKILDNLPSYNINKNDLLKIMQDYPVNFFSVETKNSKDDLTYSVCTKKENATIKNSSFYGYAANQEYIFNLGTVQKSVSNR